MKIKLMVFPVFLSVIWGCTNVNQSTDVSNFIAAENAIDLFINDLMLDQQIPGYTISITNKDSLIFSKSYGYADLKLRKKVNSATLFQIGSITKSFTAIALMQLFDEGKFDPNLPLSNYLGWFHINDDNPPVTGHHLLTHTSGIIANNDGVYPSPSLGISAGQLNTSWEPGEKFHYSNVGFSVLHLLIEQLSGMSYREYLQENIIQPLGMHSTKVGITMESRGLQAIGYVYPFDDRPHHSSRDLVEATFFEYGIGDGCIQTTSLDMAKYMQMLINRGTYSGNRIISEEAFDLFTGISQQHQSNEWYQYAINVSENGSEILLSHSGGMVAFNSRILVDISNEIGVFVSANTQFGSVYEVSDYLMQVTKSVLEGMDLPTYETKSTSPNLAHDEYFGRYVGRNGETIIINSENDSLVIETDDKRITLDQIDSTNFYTPTHGFDLYYWTFNKLDSTGLFKLIYGDQVFLPSIQNESIHNNLRIEWNEFTGKYRSYSPWLSYFEVIQREGELKLIAGYWGEMNLIEVSNTRFKINDPDSPEYIEFVREINGHVLKANLSGHTYYWLGM